MWESWQRIWNLQGFGEHHGLSTDSMFTDMNPGYKGSTTRNVTETQPKTNRILWEEISIRERSKPRPLTSGHLERVFVDPPRK